MDYQRSSDLYSFRRLLKVEMVILLLGLFTLLPSGLFAWKAVAAINEQLDSIKFFYSYMDNAVALRTSQTVLLQLAMYQCYNPQKKFACRSDNTRPSSQSEQVLGLTRGPYLRRCNNRLMKVMKLKLDWPRV